GAYLTTLPTAQLSPLTSLLRSSPVASHLPASDTLSLRVALPVLVGFSWSLTVTICVAVSGLPLLSVTVQVTVVSPLGNWAGASLGGLDVGQLLAVNALRWSSRVA